MISQNARKLSWIAGRVVLCLPILSYAQAPAVPSALAARAAQAVLDALGVDANGWRDGARVHALVDAPDPRLRLGACASPLDARVEGDTAARGRALVRVRCTTAPQWSVFVPVRIESDAPVLVLTRPLQRGQRILAEDVRVDTRRFSGVSENYVKSAEELPRYLMKRPLPAGSLLARDALELAPAVQRGARVTLRSEAGGFRIEMAGRALADAAPGQRVRVQNENSLKVVEGTADSGGVVRLDP
jgi:flagella basal body P-ring formation protein FlgA